MLGYTVQNIRDAISDQRNVVEKLGSNQQILNNKVLISVKDWLLPLYNHMESLNAEMARFEPTILGSVEIKNEAFLKLRSSWLEYADGFRAVILLRLGK